MSSQPPAKFYSSLIYEDQVAEINAHHRSQNWLLSYVDVFILIIMLVITLISLSNFKEQSAIEKIPQETQQNTQITVNHTTDIPQQNTPKIVENTQSEIDLPISNIYNQKQPITPTSPLTEQPTEIINQPTESKNTKDSQPITEAEKPQAKSKTDDESNLREKFKNSLSELGLIDSVNMTISLGYAQLEIQDKILFKSSEAVLVNKGKELLTKLIPLLKQSSGLIYIEGHTDSRPINTVKFPSNWELGAARATSVLHFLASQQLNANRLRAVSYGDTKPIADNSTAEGREKNRRVNMIIKVSDKID